jgi:hypothetical protein
MHLHLYTALEISFIVGIAAKSSRLILEGFMFERQFEFEMSSEFFGPVVGIFECMSSLNGSFFGRDCWGFMEERAKTYAMAPMSPLNSPIFF